MVKLILVDLKGVRLSSEKEREREKEFLERLEINACVAVD